MPTWCLKLVYETSCRHKVPLVLEEASFIPIQPFFLLYHSGKQLWPSGAIFSCSHCLRGHNSWRNSWQFLLHSIVDNTTHDDILWCTILAQVNAGWCLGWWYIGIGIGIWECDQRRSHQNLFLGTYFTICIQLKLLYMVWGPRWHGPHAIWKFSLWFNPQKLHLPSIARSIRCWHPPNLTHLIVLVIFYIWFMN